MTTSTMTSRQRVLRMLQRREHDRVPRFDTFWPETITRWQSEGLIGGAETVLEMLRGDFWGVASCFPAPMPGLWEELGGDEETVLIRNGWGATQRCWRKRSGTPEHVGWECDGQATWLALFKRAYLQQDLQVDPDKARRSAAQGRALGKFLFLRGGETFEALRQLIGDEAAMIALMDDPQWIADISRTFTDVTLRNFDALWDAGVRADALWIYGDMAFNHGTFCSPELYRQVIWPDHQRLCAWAHQRDLQFIFHTDGDVRGVLDLYLEAGFDCLQPLEAKAHMDVRQLAPRYGEKLAFFGNIDVMVMMTNDLPRIEQEISAKFAAGMAGRGYAYHSDHSVPPQVSWPTYQRIIQWVERYGRYS